MGCAMLRGWIAGGVSPDRLTVIDPAAKDLPEGIALYRSAAEVDRSFGTALLAIKPQMLVALAPEIAPLLAPDALLVSILAGAKSETLKHHFPTANIVRLMPNLSASIGKSPLGLYSDDLTDEGKQQLEVLLTPLGTPVWLSDEAQMDVVTALAGSGPAFVYRFIDALAKGGVEAGLTSEMAAQLALATVEGAASLAATSDESPAELAARVTSPGGTTAAGLAVLDGDAALDNLIAATLRAAAERGAELAKGAENI
jgi:pyrroline-5-carboxylate reductase